MSVFGGDSWGREAQQRKRRVDDLLLSSSSSSLYKKLSNGKYSCVVCPHNPMLDSPLAFSLHAKGSRHIAAASRIKEREMSIKEEVNKRIALSPDSTASSGIIGSSKESKAKNQPLIEQTRKAILEAQCKRFWNQSSKQFSYSETANAASISDTKVELEGTFKMKESGSVVINKDSNKLLLEWNETLRVRREKELKFISAGWKRDGFGKWYKDDNVEFDSDEEDPNDCLL